MLFVQLHSILYPCDAVSAERLVHLASQTSGVKYIRLTRPKTLVVYNNKDTFELGDFKILRQSRNDKAVVVCAGITVSESLKAYERLSHDGIDIAVVDCFCVKPFDGKKFVDLVRKSGRRIIIAEDHYKEGGIGEMIMAECVGNDFEIEHLCVREIPHSGSKDKLLEVYGINERAISRAVRKLCKLNYSLVSCN